MFALLSRRVFVPVRSVSGLVVRPRLFCTSSSSGDKPAGDKPADASVEAESSESALPLQEVPRFPELTLQEARRLAENVRLF